MIELLRRALAAVDPAESTARALSERQRQRRRQRPRQRPESGLVDVDGDVDVDVDDPVWVLAVGKAAPAMAEGALRVVTPRGLIVVAPDGTDPRGLDVVRAAHPVPDARSEAAGRALLAFAAAVPAGETMLALISGGASALAAVPAPGVRLADKVARVSALAASGAPIAAVNALRTSLSAIKGGRLAAACPGRVVTVVISDVVGDDPAVVGSGPTVPCDACVVAGGIGAMARAAAEVCGGVVIDDALIGDVEAVAPRIARTIRDGAGQRGGPGGASATARAWGHLPGAGGACDAGVPRAATDRYMVWAGEPTVRLPARPGRGGRARHLALLIARELAGVPGWELLVAGTDGVDGTPDAAGAIVDGATWAALDDPDGALARFDAGAALAAIGADVVTGPTGVNHADLLIARRGT